MMTSIHIHPCIAAFIAPNVDVRPPVENEHAPDRVHPLSDSTPHLDPARRGLVRRLLTRIRLGNVTWSASCRPSPLTLSP